jgi:hypothetical protein
LIGLGIPFSSISTTGSYGEQWTGFTGRSADVDEGEGTGREGVHTREIGFGLAEEVNEFYWRRGLWLF